MTTIPDSFLASYFDRIGYRGPIEPTLDVLRQLHLLHPQAIPFENLAPYTGQRVPLDLDAVAEKMIARRRGGYCFEHNTLLLAVLRQMGFQVTPLIARVRWQVPAEIHTGLTHMLLRVELEGRSWFADVAFGSTTQTAPLEFLPGVAQTTPHGVFRITQAADELSLEFRTSAGWQTVYRYTLEPVADVDFEIGNWYTSSHPQSVFLNSLLVSRTQPGARELMVNDTYTRRDNDGSLQKHQHADASAWADCLRQRFDLDLGLDEAVSLFRRVAARGNDAGIAELAPS
ncbi:arylamine N-acetyltransferase family protein [Achromobacter sp.]|uniref:arylamine N-acetyltransferase family protein n=1 Tax=Achromobacter sp. TaxID=134375 RepID=UPI003C744A10